MSKSSFQPLDQHTVEVLDIINAPPAWFLRWGTYLTFSVMVAVILSILFKQPSQVVKSIIRFQASADKQSIIGEVLLPQDYAPKGEADRHLKLKITTLRHETIFKDDKTVSIINLTGLKGNRLIAVFKFNVEDSVALKKFLGAKSRAPILVEFKLTKKSLWYILFSGHLRSINAND